MAKLTIVIFGSTGNLSRIKLLPSLEKLLQDRLIDNSLNIIAVGRRPLNNKTYYEYIKTHLKNDILKDKIHYFKSDIDKDDGLEGLPDFLDDLDRKDSDIIFYFATPYNFYKTITTQLKTYNLITEKNDIFRRLVFEKPFGDDHDSATGLLDDLNSSIESRQLFFVDHYLIKEGIQNIIVLRFMNDIYESTLTARYVKDIQITIHEKTGILDRGQYYDNSGIIRDMFQSHILQIIALLTMKNPEDITMDKLIHSRLEAIRNIKIPKNLDHNIVLGQYSAYRKEEHVLQNSKTPTYLALKLEIGQGSLKGVPVYIRSGKAMHKRYARIVIELKDTKNIFTGKKIEGNKLILDIQPDAGVTTIFNNKIPGLSFDIKQVKNCFSHNLNFTETPRGGYERMFHEVYEGNHLFFSSREEILASWSLADELIKQVRNKKIPLVIYEKDAVSLKDAEVMIEDSGFKWYEMIL